MIPPNPQTEDEIIDSFLGAQKHPRIWIMQWHTRFGVLRRRLLDLPKFDGKREMLFRGMLESMDMTERLYHLLCDELNSAGGE